MMQAEGAQFVRFEPSAEQLTAIREALATGEVAGLSADNFAVGTIPSSLDDLGSVRDILITEGGVDADGNHVPPSLLFDPDVLQKQGSLPKTPSPMTPKSAISFSASSTRSETMISAPWTVAAPLTTSHRSSRA